MGDLSLVWGGGVIYRKRKIVTDIVYFVRERKRLPSTLSPDKFRFLLPGPRYPGRKITAAINYRDAVFFKHKNAKYA